MLGPQLDLIPGDPRLPDGFRYREDLISAADERELLGRLRRSPLKELEFHGFTARRRTLSFGHHYDFARERLGAADEIPDWLLPLRERAAAFAALDPERLVHALILEYSAGSAIGWHRDKAVFGDVIGISLLAPCRFRLRRKAGGTWERAALTLAPRSAYLLRGPARTEWEHSIPAVEELRYSITFRSLASA
jgi:alkylated DNA repair dioxygenase AlkB